MITTTKRHTLEELVSGATHDELVWMNGFLAGVLSVNQPQQIAQQTKTISKITLVYGTETGNAKSLATTLAAQAKQQGIQVKLAGLDQYRLSDLAKEEYFVVVISTQGDGEPPQAALKFYNHIQEATLSLPKLQYAVLGLGDTAYPLFCQTGIDVDQFLAQRGGRRILPLQKCDTDYEDQAQHWFGQLLHTLQQAAPQTAAPQVATKPSTARKNYTGVILSNVNLNDRGSQKETYHIEIAVDGIEYQPGDAIGILPENPDRMVESIITHLGIGRTEIIPYRGEPFVFYELLKRKVNITCLPVRLVKKYASIVQQNIPDARISLTNLLKIYPVKDREQLQQVIDMLEPIAPRLYSISSSPNAHPDEVHITVSRDTFLVEGELEYGLCSDYLAHYQEGEHLSLYVHPNKKFNLPAPDKDIIMVGPGTGIAPFRSFLADRDATMASGRNWLFFGEQHFTTDFLYQTELQNWFNTSVLTRLNTAFSRDQTEKIYVQHRLREHGADVWKWLTSGAYFYVCGAKDPMSADVEQTLLEICVQHGGHSQESALAYLEQLGAEGRYLKDVY